VKNYSPIISIIIPVFNCETLVSFTLESLLSQTFEDWECILINDHSTDNVFDVLLNFQSKDDRFKIFQKPKQLKQGANISRNYGFSLSKGIFVKWFDCDDLMDQNHLELVYKTITQGNWDFVISDSINFDTESEADLGKPYLFNKDEAVISARNLALNKIGWITDDFFVKRAAVEELKFNEDITSIGDEYNFFVRLLHTTTKGVFLDQILTRRRIHGNSITNKQVENEVENWRRIAVVKYQTAKDLVMYQNTDLIRWFLAGYMRYSFLIAGEQHMPPYLFKSLSKIVRHFGFRKMLYYVLAISSNYIFKKGYWFLKKAKQY
jgi:glycosyltransferase involved in cell wall biosynthesis